MNLFNNGQNAFNTILEQSSPIVKDYVSRLNSIPQGHLWHPEGNVLIHTKIVLNRTLQYKDVNITLAAFFHDLGKVDTTKRNDTGGYSAHDHETISADLVKFSKDTIKFFGGNVDIVYWLVINHMRVKYIDEMKIKKRNELTKHMWFPLLELFAPCDRMGTLTTYEIIKVGGNPFMFLFNKFRIFLKK